mmetsp:Transcript_22104/g.50573  ORF Transcript_22104/g.50573 Transcript_22104/m.50573 type:complete len:236 (-) Transcript_22104:1257-1964(-)
MSATDFRTNDRGPDRSSLRLLGATFPPSTSWPSVGPAADSPPSSSSPALRCSSDGSSAGDSSAPSSRKRWLTKFVDIRSELIARLTPTEFTSELITRFIAPSSSRTSSVVGTSSQSSTTVGRLHVSLSFLFFFLTVAATRSCASSPASSFLFFFLVLGFSSPLSSSTACFFSSAIPFRRPRATNRWLTLLANRPSLPNAAGSGLHWPNPLTLNRWLTLLARRPPMLLSSLRLVAR